MSTHIPSPAEIQSHWHVIDADGEVLGRLATRAAVLLMGKHKPDYTPFLATGDHVVVINAAKVKLTGRKEQDKLYRRYSGYPGGLRQTTTAKLRATRPERIIEQAILGMLPKNKLGKHLGRMLRVYGGSQHPHAGQKPAPFEIK